MRAPKWPRTSCALRNSPIVAHATAGMAHALRVLQASETLVHLRQGAEMLNVQKILVPVDFSECSGAAVDYAAFLASSFGARVTLLHAWQPPADLGPFLGQVAIRDPDSGKDRTLAEFVESQSRRALDGLLERLEAKGLDVEGKLEAGAARKTIIAVSEADGYDLIVLGTHGRTGLAHAVMGSVAEWVVRHATVPVLTVRADEAVGETVPVGEQAPAAG